MDMTPDILANAAVGFLVIVGAVGLYLRTLRQPKPDPSMSGIGGGFVDRDQMERLIAQVKRIADAITDKNAATMTDKLDELADKIDHMRTPPARRR